MITLYLFIAWLSVILPMSIGAELEDRKIIRIKNDVIVFILGALSIVLGISYIISFVLWLIL